MSDNETSDWLKQGKNANATTTRKSLHIEVDADFVYHQPINNISLAEICHCAILPSFHNIALSCKAGSLSAMWCALFVNVSHLLD